MARMLERRGVLGVVVGNPEGKSTMGRPRRCWEYSIKMNFRKWYGAVGFGWSWISIGIVGGHL
jgi:hypothetical protein